MRGTGKCKNCSLAILSVRERERECVFVEKNRIRRKGYLFNALSKSGDQVW